MREVEYAVRITVMRNAYRIVVGKFERNRSLVDLCVRGRMLKWTLKKSQRMFIEFV